MSNPLEARALLALTPLLLPTAAHSSPLPRPTDSVAALVHAIHTALGFRLAGSDANQGQAPQDDSPATAGPSGGENGESSMDDDAMSETTTAVDVDDPTHLPTAPPGTILPAGWNARGEDAYNFEYTHPQSAMTFRVRVGRMGSRVQIDAMADDGEPFNLSEVVGELVNAQAFPIPSAATATDQDSDADGSRALGFVSADAVRTFVDQYDRQIIARLIPGLNKEGYRTPSVTRAGPSGDRPPPPSGPGSNPRPSIPQPARPHVPVDPLHPDVAPAGVPSASVGHRDLDPLANHGVPSLRDERGGGMIMDFNHPIFDGRRPPDGAQGPGGSINPPGARWDPVGPGVPGGPAPRGEGSLRFPSAGGNPLGGVGITDPEWQQGRWGDEMPPPGEFGPDIGGFGMGGRGGGFGGMGGMGGLGGGPRFPGGPRRGGGPGGFGGGFGGGGFGGGFGGGGFGGGGGII